MLRVPRDAAVARDGGDGRVRGASASRRRLHFDVEELQQYYHLPLKTAAKRLGICEAALKRICRRNQIRKWPYRQLQSLLRRLDESVPDSDGAAPPSDSFLLPHELQVKRQHCAEDAKQQQLQVERERIIQAAHTDAHAGATLQLQQPAATRAPPERSPARPCDTALSVLASLCSAAPSMRSAASSSTPDAGRSTEVSIHHTPVRILRLMMQS
ncbi:hypothetical protein ATCC90586_007443 [Pythium insidiosum]|nr:hypothetical protein ATCC90586_007443 [Pythium insidiosum]